MGMPQRVEFPVRPPKRRLASADIPAISAAGCGLLIFVGLVCGLLAMIHDMQL